MPSLDDILLQTMPLASHKGLVKKFKGADADLSANAPDPNVDKSKPGPDLDPSIRRTVAVWSWSHKASDPACATNITSRVLGMGMYYQMPMTVCDEIRLKEVSAAVIGGAKLDKSHFPLTQDFVLRKYQVNEGVISASSQGYWRLDTYVDQSLLVVFGYEFQNGSDQPQPISQDAAQAQDLMPDTPGSRAQVMVNQLQAAVIRPIRVIVCFSLTCCKERNDFEPGEVLGANRIYPHVMLMSNVNLEKAGAVINVVRPGQSSHYAPEMQQDIGPVLFTDTNNPPSQWVGPRVPFWDNMFDYYETDPFKSPFASGIKVVEGDPSSKRSQKGTEADGERKMTGAITTQGTLFGRNTRDLLKMPRQGDFDNLHMAPKMTISSFADNQYVRAILKLDTVTMAPFCVHDCLHTHFRWGKSASAWVGAEALPISNQGFDEAFNPNTKIGTPLVPHNQSVTLTLIKPAGFSYEATAHFDIRAGQWQVFFHHGMAYANEIWKEGTVDAARLTLQTAARAEEQTRSAPNFSPCEETNSWAVFYWRLRYSYYDQDARKLVERLGRAPNIPLQNCVTF